MKSAWIGAVVTLLTLSGCSIDPRMANEINGINNMSECPALFRVATFNVSMEAGNYLEEGATEDLSAEVLRRHLRSGKHSQIQAIAEIIQRVRPDILLLNEFDYIHPQSEGLDRFQHNYLSQSQAGQPPIKYAHRFVAPVNTGVEMPLDQNGDGKITLPDDAYGFGHYAGQYGMAVLSRYPIDTREVRTFQHFQWKDMPGALKPYAPDGTPYYADPVWELFRLSSKSHWDLPLQINGQTLHLLASHPTPPVFDGPEDRNGKRNHDEIRFWVDYLDNADYLYDDQGNPGGLKASEAFVIAGDLNASPVEGDSHREAIQSLLGHQRINAVVPHSAGGQQARPKDPHSASHTVSWGLRADYVLPSKTLQVKGSGVFWPEKGDPLYPLVRQRSASSDHRLVWVDLYLPGRQEALSGSTNSTR